MIHNSFVLRNDRPETLTLNIEPEGAFFPLSAGEEVSVTDSFTSVPATLRLTNSKVGELIVSIWPGDGEVTARHHGVDVLELQ